MFLKKGGVNIHDINAYNKYLYCYKDFRGLCIKRPFRGAYKRNHSFYSTNLFICDNTGSIIVDFIGRFESLEKDVEKLSEMLDIEINLPHLNINEKRLLYIYR